MRIGDDVLEVSSFGSNVFNGVDNTDFPKEMGQIASVSYSQVDERKHEFIIHLGGAESIVLTAFKDLVSVKMVNSTMASFGRSKGMMGQYTTGKLLARDGKPEVKDSNQFGQE